MSKKIGVITVHKNVNYGANLQAFASCRYLNKQGFDCRLIDYTLPTHEKSAHLFSWLKQSWDAERDKLLSRKIKLAIALALSAPWKRKRLKAFAEFRKKYITMTKPCKTMQDIVNLGLDTVVCGSDQIWNPDIIGSINPIFFGDVDGIKNKISYAASVGKDKYLEKDELKVKKLIEKLDYVSLREEDTAKYFSTLTEKKVETVCDPVFLLDKSEYDKVLSKRRIKGDYVLLYSVVHNDELTAVAKKYAKRHHLPLIEICSSKDKNATHKQIVTYGPTEFLSSFKYAKTVFTNSFHGTAFSIIFEKDFYVFDNKHRGSRITNVLEKTGLIDRLISNSVESDFNSIDYAVVNENVSRYVRSSKEFLDKALSIDKEYLAGKTCVGCGACKSVCKCDAIRLINNKEGFITSVIDNSKCLNCGLCKKVCPALNPVKKNSVTSSVYAFKAEDNLRKNSTSGGAFVALATEVLNDKGVVYGAKLLENKRVVHARIDNLFDLVSVQGTKYLPSDIADCYGLIANDLLNGKTVLFSGTPCQVDGVVRYLNLKKIPTEKFITVDIICHGVPSPTIFNSYMNWLEKEYKSKVKSYYFRSKKISWRGSSCYAVLENGKELKNDKNLCAFMNVYYSDNITRESCYTCSYASKNRVGDLTISDYWGLENLDKSFEDTLGVSMVLVNTDKGRELFEKTEGERIAGNIETAKQPQIYKPILLPQGRDEFWAEYVQKGIKPLLKKYGGIKRDSLKTVLYKIKKKILK